MTEPAAKPVLSPWPVRLIVFAAMVGLALLAIRIIDSHVMARADAMLNVHVPTPSSVLSVSTSQPTPSTAATHDPQP